MTSTTVPIIVKLELALNEHPGDLLRGVAEFADMMAEETGEARYRHAAGSLRAENPPGGQATHRYQMLTASALAMLSQGIPIDKVLAALTTDKDVRDYLRKILRGHERKHIHSAV